MPLAPGSRLGPYEILGLLGAGGMGEVYRATDTILIRQVALKVLPEAFAADPDRVARFKREAQVLASLNHTHIAQVYGFETSGSVSALAMELVEGPTLADRIAKSALPLDEALAIARQIADALEAAHEQGIIHRDLKPANIKLRADGVVKVLDFGLAKALDPTSAAPGSDPVHSPTRLPTMSSPAMTRVGVILGTAAYMSPEQASGGEIDERSDIWSFGVVLYEMLTGRPLFEGDSVARVLARVLERELDFKALPPATPPAIRKLLRRCLERDRARRLHAIADARLEIEDVLAGRDEDRPAPFPATHAHSTGGRLWWVLGALVLLLAAGAMVALWAPWRHVSPPDRPLVRLDVDLGPDVALPGLDRSFMMPVALSPDGTRVAYVASVGGGQQRLFVRRLDQPKAVELPGTEGASGPVFSPDCRWLAFYIGTRLNKISVEGGATVPLFDAGGGTQGAAWSGDDIVFGAGGKGLMRIPATGTPTAVTELGGDFALAFPQVLPGGKAVLFTVYGRPPSADRARIEVVSLTDHRRKTLVQGGTSARYVAAGDGTGYLVYTTNGTLFGIPFDVDRLETQGVALPIVADVAVQPGSGSAQIALSHDTLIFRRGAAGAASGLVTVQWVDAAGTRTPAPVRPGTYNGLRISPDGNNLALIEGGSSAGVVWVYDQTRDATRRLASGTTGPFPTLVWSPDGRYLVLGLIGTGIVWTRADGAGQPQTLLASKDIQVTFSFSPDGKHLGYIDIEKTPQLWTVPVEETGGQLKAGKPERFLRSQSFDFGPLFSPDGRWVAYSSQVSPGNQEVYVRPFPPPTTGQGGQWQVSNNGGTDPVWSPNGHDLLYRRDDQILAVTYTAKGDAFIADKPRVWIARLGGSAWDLAPDGKRVAVLTPVETQDAPKPEHTVVLLQNFADELRRRVPIK